MGKVRKIGIGIDIGGGHINAGAVDLTKGVLIDTSVFEEKINSKGTADEILKTWSRVINKTLESVERQEIRGLGIAMPGAFNYKKGIALFSDTDKYNELHGLEVASALRPYLLLPDLPIRFINDATAFAIGTSWVGESKGFQNSTVITLGTGFGSAIIKDEKPLVQGVNIPEHGCFWHLPFKEGIADDYFSTRWFINRYLGLTGEKVDGVKYIDQQYESNAQSKMVFNEFGEMLAEFIAPWLSRLKTDVLIIGGNISRSLSYFEKPLIAELQKQGIEIQVRGSSMFESAALIGSSRLLVDDYWESIKDDLPEK